MAKQTIKEFCIAQCAKGKPNQKVAELAQKKYGSATTAGCVAWYKCHAKKEGLL